MYKFPYLIWNNNLNYVKLKEFNNKSKLQFITQITLKGFTSNLILNNVK